MGTEREMPKGNLRMPREIEEMINVLFLMGNNLINVVEAPTGNQDVELVLQNGGSNVIQI